MRILCSLPLRSARLGLVALRTKWVTRQKSEQRNLQDGPIWQPRQTLPPAAMHECISIPAKLWTTDFVFSQRPHHIERNKHETPSQPRSDTSRRTAAVCGGGDTAGDRSLLLVRVRCTRVYACRLLRAPSRGLLLV